METGKLPPGDLMQKVLRHSGARRDEVVVPAGFGEDSAVLDFGEDLCVVSTDPITGSGSALGRLAVHISCNDIASCGAEPVGLLLTLLLPRHCSTDDVENIMKEASETASQLGVQIVGGHTEVTPGLSDILVSATALGRVSGEELVTSSGLKPGHYLVLTKGAALEGTAIIAQDYEERLRGLLSPSEISTAQQLGDLLSVVREGRLAAERKATAMHDVTEGGLLGALYEMASASQVGLRIREDAILVREVTHMICDHFDLDYLKLIGSGAMLVGMEDRAAACQLVEDLRDHGIESSVIGEAVKSEEGKQLLRTGGVVKEIEEPRSDELWRLIDELQN